MELIDYMFIILCILEAVWIMYLQTALNNSQREAKEREFKMSELLGEQWVYEKRIAQFEKELRLYATIIKDHGLEVKDES